MPRMTDAYAAGLMDGEGCVTIVEAHGNYSVRVDVGMTEKARDILELMHATNGGSIGMARGATERWDAAWRWTLCGAEASEFLERILPHLILKAEQARLAIRLQSIIDEMSAGRKNARWTAEGRARAASIRLRVMELNRKGPSRAAKVEPPEGAELFAIRAGGQWMQPQRDLFSDLGWAPLSKAWPSAATVFHGQCWTLSSSAWRSDGSACSLSETLEEGPIPARFSLSPRACAGILRRAGRRGRDIPEALRRALEAVPERAPQGAEWPARSEITTGADVTAHGAKSTT